MSFLEIMGAIFIIIVLLIGGLILTMYIVATTLFGGASIAIAKGIKDGTIKPTDKKDEPPVTAAPPVPPPPQAGLAPDAPPAVTSFKSHFEGADWALVDDVKNAPRVGQDHVEAEFSIMNYFRELWSKAGKVITSVGSEIVSLDSSLTPNQVELVEISAANLTPGMCIDLYRLTGNPMLKTTGFQDGQKYDAQYCVDADGNTTVDMCKIGRFAFSRAKSCWIFEGGLSDLKSSSVDTTQKWPLATLRNQANTGNGLAPIMDPSTCPFPSDDCKALWTYFSDGQAGMKTFSNGSKYEYDGAFVRRLI